jgi:hypothetical protein
LPLFVGAVFLPLGVIGLWVAIEGKK